MDKRKINGLEIHLQLDIMSYQQNQLIQWKFICLLSTVYYVWLLISIWTFLGQH